MNEIHRGSINSQVLDQRIAGWRNYIRHVSRHFGLVPSRERVEYEFQEAVYRTLRGERVGTCTPPLLKYVNHKLLHTLQVRQTELNAAKEQIENSRKELYKSRQETQKAEGELSAVLQTARRAMDASFQAAAIEAGSEIHLILRSFEPGKFIFSNDPDELYNFLDGTLQESGPLVIRKFQPRRETAPIVGAWPEVQFMALANAICRAAEKPTFFDRER